MCFLALIVKPFLVSVIEMEEVKDEKFQVTLTQAVL